MIEAIPATTICLILFTLLMALPLLEKLPKVGTVVSLRWAVVAVVITSLVAVIINFVQLSDTVRETVIVGGLVIGCLWIVLRSIELWLYRGYIAKAEKIEVDVEEKKLVVEKASIGKKGDEKENQQEDAEHE